MASFTLERAGLDGSTLSDAQMAELKATADALCAPGKGFLASDESAGPWLRAGHAEAKKIPDTEENRAAYRSMLYTTPGLSDYISGVILHTETLYQKDAAGTQVRAPRAADADAGARAREEARALVSRFARPVARSRAGGGGGGYGRARRLRSRVANRAYARARAPLSLALSRARRWSTSSPARA